MAELLNVTDQFFKQEVLDSKTPVLVDFWAKWCMPCNMMAPVLEELSKQSADKLKIVKLDVEINPATASSYHITNIPALLLFKNGKETDRIIGLRSLEDLKDFVKKHIS